MKKAVIYTRVSTNEQIENGYSLHDQESRLRKECERKGYEVIAHYKDIYSAKSFDKPEFQHFLSQLKCREVKPDVFVCLCMDRFTRNISEGFQVISELKKNGIDFEILEDGGNLEKLIPFVLEMGLAKVERKDSSLNVNCVM